MITIVPYDPDWPRQFEQERARLADALGAIAIRIEHHGSTAVPGLDAKPVIDIQVSVAQLQPMDTYAAALARACSGVRAPGIAQVTASNIRIHRSASCAMVDPDGTNARSSSTASRPTS